jgi:V/A-type H+-transporting ATPase subunit I
LTENGYTEISVPQIEGSPAEALAKAEAEIVENEAKLEAANAKIAELSDKYKSFIAASDEQLSLTVQKGELPLRVATSEYSFVIDAWVPTKDLENAQKELESRMGGSVYIEVQETRGRSMHETEAQEERFQQTPTKCNNGNLGKRFEYAVSLVSIPKYQEIDPATLVSLFFPFFFGFMVGDFGYAIPFIVLGAYGMMKAKSKDFQSIGTVLFFGGIWAAIFGFFFFGEMFGMHFIGPSDGTSVTWESLLGVTLPEWFKGIMIESVEGAETSYGISKLHAVTMLLKLSVYMGCVHLFIAYVVGFMNGVRQHGLKEGYLEKGGWIFSFLGMVTFCYGLTNVLFNPAGITAPMATETVVSLIVGAVLLVIGVASCFPKEGAQAILELPGIVGNVLSYTRLAAIGMSKAGMALAFNYIAFIMMWQTIGGIGGIIAGCVVFLIGHLMIWVLAILSAGLHGLRLQYVESMNKFFTGGGVLFAPLAIKRKHTKVVKNIETEA